MYVAKFILVSDCTCSKRVFALIYEWIGKNAQLKDVSERVTEFFKIGGFDVVAEEQGDVWVVSAMKRVNDAKYVVFVKIYGTPEDLFVKFDRGTYGRVFGMFGNVVSSFGFGVLARRDLNKEAFLESFETRFWDYMEEFLHTKHDDESKL